MLERLLEGYRVMVVCAGRVLEWGLDGWGIKFGWGLIVGWGGNGVGD